MCAPMAVAPVGGALGGVIGGGGGGAMGAGGVASVVGDSSGSIAAAMSSSMGGALGVGAAGAQPPVEKPVPRSLEMLEQAKKAAFLQALAAIGGVGALRS